MNNTMNVSSPNFGMAHVKHTESLTKAAQKMTTEQVNELSKAFKDAGAKLKDTKFADLHTQAGFDGVVYNVIYYKNPSLNKGNIVYSTVVACADKNIAQAVQETLEKENSIAARDAALRGFAEALK